MAATITYTSGEHGQRMPLWAVLPAPTPPPITSKSLVGINGYWRDEAH